MNDAGVGLDPRPTPASFLCRSVRYGMFRP